MGYGTWTTASFVNYSSTKGMSVDSRGVLDVDLSAQEMFKSRKIDPDMNPYGVNRECVNSIEHPNTVPVILALDVTGSMGPTATEIAKKLNIIMTDLFNKVADVEFMIMGIGDLAYDDAPIQTSQFESDIRIAEQLDKIYFEGGGGGNRYESYTAAWYFGSRHTKLDCWKSGRKGIIITMGDEPLNPYLPQNSLKRSTGDTIQSDIETKTLYEEVIEKYNVYHLAVKDDRNMFRHYDSMIRSSFGQYLDKDHLLTVTLDSIEKTIVDIVVKESKIQSILSNTNNSVTNEITW